MSADFITVYILIDVGLLVSTIVWLKVDNCLLGCTLVANTVFMLETLLFTWQLNTPVEIENALLTSRIRCY